MVKGTTKLLGIIGDPISHSLSPAMHNIAFEATGMDCIYVPLPVRPKHLGEAVRGLCSLGFMGVNVTVPHKEKVLPFLDRVSDEAARIGSVNTIKIHDGRVLGDNTDWQGFLNHLAEIPFDPEGSEALILGSGGSARSVAYALLSKGARVTLCGRSIETTAKVAEHFRKFFPATNPGAMTYDQLSLQRINADMVINTTPLGMPPQFSSSPWPEKAMFPKCGLVYDLVYNPPITPFIEQALKNGVRAVNGLGMLVHQAALAFNIWTGIPAPLEAMRRAVTLC
ncbi:MAG TPA: shikimate dehydrogenase [Desulfomonilaceae bacterium]|nr:shikimate dehydrogenase [Desulfomonilaceae bacterium]